MDIIKKTEEQQKYEKLAYSIFMLEFEIAMQKEQIKKAKVKKEETILRIGKLEELAVENTGKLDTLKEKMKDAFDTDYDIEF